MPRKLFKRIAPSQASLKENKILGCLGNTFLRPHLWQFNRHSLAKACSIGLFCMWIPLPIQTLFAACLAIIYRANLPISVLLVYITNPITIPPMFYFAYRLGSAVYGDEPYDLEFAWQNGEITNLISAIAPAMLSGLFLLAVASSALAYFGVHLLWRLHLVQRWKSRRVKQ